MSLSLVLASRSPRRLQLLKAADISVRTHVPQLDDGELIMGKVSPLQWVASLAWFKAAQIAASHPEELVLAADTVCAHGDAVLGQPVDAAHARSMLQQMRNAVHLTMTGVCLVRPRRAHESVATVRQLFVDVAAVRVGDIDDATIEAYLETESWRGKAGAYNLSERIDAGWPIQCDGDPTTVMGLPMRQLPDWINCAMKNAPAASNGDQHVAG